MARLFDGVAKQIRSATSRAAGPAWPASAQRLCGRVFGNLPKLSAHDPILLQDQVARFRELLDLDPNDPLNWVGLGRCLVRLGRATEAVHALRRAIELDPGDVLAHRDLGHFLLDTGHSNEAAEIFARAIALAEAAGDIKTGREIHAFLRRAEKGLDAD